MRILATILFLLFSINTFSQVNYTANDVVPEYTGFFRPGVNPGNYNNWTDEQVADLAAGNPYLGVPGIGAKTLRPSLPEVFLDVFGYDVRLGAFQYNENLGMEDNVCFIGYPNLSHRDTTQYCPGQISELFANMYEPIWDGGLNGTPYNDSNYLAAYTYKTVMLYKDYVRFWEIWNEPSLDRSNFKATLPPDHPLSWWQNDPEPCDLAIQAPVYQYIRMLRVCYDVIKTVDPDAYVSLGGVGYYSFFDVLCRNTDNPVDGSVTPEYPLKGGAYFDAVGIHTYPHFDGSLYDLLVVPPDTMFSVVYKRHSDAAAVGIATGKALRQEIMAGYGYDGVTYPKKEFLITEINIPRLPFEDFNQNLYIGSEEAQRNFMAKALVTSMAVDIHQLHIYNLGDLKPEAEAESFFDVMGLYGDLANTPPYQQERTQAGIAYKTASDMIFETTWDQERTDAMNLPPDVRGGALKKTNGEYVYVLWAITTIDQSEEGSASYSFPSSFNLNNVYKKEWDFEVTEIETFISAQNIFLNTTPAFFTVNPVEVDNTDLTVDDCVELIDGFTYVGQYFGNKYFRSNNSLTWEDANDFCQSKGGHLVEIDDYAENEFLRVKISEPVMIGLNDATTEGVLEWSNGAPLTFNNIDVCDFCEGNDDVYDYLTLHSWDGKWSYTNGNVAKNFIMEIDCANFEEPTNTGGTGGCDDPVPGFTLLGNLEDTQYFISNGSNSWEEAKLLTEAQGGHLVIIDNASENLFIKGKIQEMVHIGLSDSELEEELKWVDGSSVTYDNFQICGFCQGNTNVHDYVLMHPWDGGWSYQTGVASRRYIMERVCDADTTTTGGDCNNNLAFNKPTNQSSFQLSATAARAVDGNTSGVFWQDNSVALTNWESKAWIEVDLESVQQIKEIEIWNRTDCCEGFLSNYNIYVSDEPFTSDDPNTTSAQMGVSTYYQTDIAETPSTINIDRAGRYVRVQLLGTSFLAIAELKVIGCGEVTGGCMPAGTPCDDGNASTNNDVEDGNCNCAGTPINTETCTSTSNLAIGKTVAQSSTLSAGGITGSASKAIDGNTSGIFFTSPSSISSISATQQETEAWWQIDLGAEYLIEEINFFNRTDGADRSRNCHVMISNTPFTSDNLIVAQGQATYDELISGLVGAPSNLAPNTKGRYIRVQRNDFGYLLIAEFEVIGCVAPTIPFQLPPVEEQPADIELDINSVKIFPNPTNEFIHVALTDLSDKKTTIGIFNSLGQRVLEQNYEAIPSEPITFDVSKLVSGVYFVNIKLEGQRSITKKFVVGGR